jgi:predicted TIM-barrel fold metal-dependent hydrolase
MTNLNDLRLHEFQPNPQLVTQSTLIEKPRFPVIDAHNHLGGAFESIWASRSVSELLDLLDEANVRAYVDLDGGWGEDILHSHLDKYKAFAPDRFVVFGGVDWSKWKEHDNQFGEWAATRLRLQAERGAQGLKIWKPFGLQVTDQIDELVAIDDERLDPIWATAGELGLPVVIHIADPVAFFDPIDVTNERIEELARHPDWHFPSPPYPTFMTLMQDFKSLVTRHPNTTFVGAHVGCYAENLLWVADMLDACSNFYVDISARIGELGRQPYSARKFFIKYADRILFGTDATPNLDVYQLYYRFLETDDEYFNYSLSPTPTQGRWHIYGLFLPDEVLEKIYFRNANRLMFKEI